MTDEVMKFLVASGGGSLDELIVRVPAPPQSIANSLTRLAGERYVRSEGPKSIQDFDALVARFGNASESDNNDKGYTRERILSEILRHERGFMDTIVRPTIRGLTHGLT